jgi:hypothetical protein
LQSRLIPRHADNGYRGYRLGLWLFGLLVLAKAAIGLGSIFNGYQAATSADGIPLDSFTPAGARTALSLFALLGFSQVLLCLVCLLVLVRYRALVSLMFVILLLYQLGRYLILHFLPIPRTAAPPGSAINLALLGVMIVGLALSLGEPRVARQ